MSKHILASSIGEGWCPWNICTIYVPFLQYIDSPDIFIYSIHLLLDQDDSVLSGGKDVVQIKKKQKVLDAQASGSKKKRVCFQKGVFGEKYGTTDGHPPAGIKRCRRKRRIPGNHRVVELITPQELQEFRELFYPDKSIYGPSLEKMTGFCELSMKRKARIEERWVVATATVQLSGALQEQTSYLNSQQHTCTHSDITVLSDIQKVDLMHTDSEWGNQWWVC